MADLLKAFFNRQLIRQIGESFTRVWPAFPFAAFEKSAVHGIDALELKARARQIADALGQSLPGSFPEAARILVTSLGAKHTSDELEGAGMAPFFYLPHTMWVATAGLDHFAEAMAVQYELTQRFTCEFSIRAFLDRYPNETLAQLTVWARDDSPHVRRLVSEGTRQRLPWASRVKVLNEQPSRAVALIELLRDDPSSMVRRSVANHLNDLSKGEPDLFYAVCTRWQKDATQERRKLLEHALRSAIKRGEPRALALLGHGAKPKIEVVATTFAPKSVKIGGKVRVSVTIRSTSKQAQSLNCDLKVMFKKARGAGAKVFKLKRVALEAKASVEFNKVISLEVHTTRMPYAGQHFTALMVNGVPFELGGFSVK